MSIKANQFIAIHIKSISIFVQNFSGRFMLRFHIYENRKGQQLHFATPFNIIESQKTLLTQHSQTNQNAYITRLFSLGVRQRITNLDEICIFKNEFDIFSFDNDYKMEMCCQLIGYIPGSGKSVISTSQGILFQPTGSQYLEINFRSPYSIKIQGSIHTTAYNYQYCSTSKYPTLESFCNSKSNQQAQNLLKYLIFEGQKNNEFLQVNKQIAQRNPMKTLAKQKSVSQDEQIKQKIMKVQSYITQRRKSCEQITQIGEDFIEFSPALKHKALSNPQGNPKRRRIFSKNNSIKTITLQQFQKTLHQNAAKIFQNWNLVLKILLDNLQSQSSKRYSGQALLNKLKQKYIIKQNKKIGEYIVKFKGSWDQDIYYHQTDIRNKIGEQIRNPLPELVVQTNQFLFSSSQLFSKTRPIYFFEEADNQPQKIKPTPSKLIVFLVHGLGACRLDMERLRVQLKRRYDEKLSVVISTANQGRTEGDISGMCIRLAQQIQHYLSRQDPKKMPMISIVGHSMGGVIIRGALPKLQKYKHLFYSFISLSSPHIGYDYSTSKLIDAGLWVINNWKKCQSLQQLTMEDSQMPEHTFLYNLSKQKGMGWFSKVSFLSSRQDSFVPYYSARIQKSQECLKDCKNKLKKGVIHSQMIQSILDSIRGKVYRIQVDFCIQKKNIQNFIGRTAHISFLNDFQMLQTFSYCSKQIMF